MNYQQFVQDKLEASSPTGFEPNTIAGPLFPHQSDLVNWSIRRGRSAIFADTGLGKTRMQLAWADAVTRETRGKVLILAPLAVAEQTVAEGRDIGVDVTHARDSGDVSDTITITNYERLHRFDTSQFVGVVLDESSCIKHHEAKTLAMLLDAFRNTAFKLCATATPAPNDWTELGTHAEFLGVCSRVEMLSEFFVHDAAKTQDWRLKGHARELFWQWVSIWGAMLTSPADLGHDDSLYQLPPLTVHEHLVEVDTEPTDGMLFALDAQTFSERRSARKNSLEERVQACADRANADQQPWVVWCDLNAESELLKKTITDSVEIKGSDSIEHKEQALADFAAGNVRVLVSKPSICGFGLNWQHCSRMAFVGVTDSFESYYQAVRRCWRFGQSKPVHVHIFASAAEGAVVANLRRKEKDAEQMKLQLSAETGKSLRASVQGLQRETNQYNADDRVQLPKFMRGCDELYRPGSYGQMGDVSR